MPQALQVKNRKTADLIPYARNARKHSEQQVSQIAASIKEFGFNVPVLVDKDNGIIAGHGRVLAAQKLGIESVPTIAIAHLTENQKKAYILADNKLALNAGWDEEMLKAELEGLAEVDFNIDLTGFDGDELAKITADKTEGKTDPDEIPEAPETPKSERGKIYQCGKHRVMCGDSTSGEDVARLMGGKKINVCFTSPPYASQREYDNSSGFKPIHPKDYSGWWENIQSNIKNELSDSGSFFVNIKEHCEDGQRHLYVKDLTIDHVRKWGWLFVDEFAWVRSGVPGKWNNRFKNGFEPVFHFSKTDKIKFFPEAVGHESDDVLSYSPDNKKTHSGFLSSGGGINGRKSGIALPNNVLKISTARAEKDRGHTAEFPVDLPVFFLNAYSEHEDAIYDPFLGSGTTMIAAEKTSRICYGMEISPAYVDVIRKRWAEFVHGKGCDWEALTPEIAGK